MASEFQISKSAQKRMRQRAARELRQQELQTQIALQALPKPAGGLLSGKLVHSPPPCGHPRGYQWRCPICDKLNDLERELCRECRFEKPLRAQLRPRGPGLKPEGPPTRPVNAKPSWKEVVAAARQAGASVDTVQALEKEAAAARAATQDAQKRRLTIGDKLNQAEAKVRRSKEAASIAQQRVTALRTQLEEAEQRAASTAQDVTTATEELDRVRQDLATAPAPAVVGQPDLVSAAKAMIELLAGMSQAPSDVVQAARQLEAGLNSAAARADKDTPAEPLDGRVAKPLDAEVRRRFGGRKAQVSEEPANEATDTEEDASMDESRGLKRIAPAAEEDQDNKDADVEEAWEDWTTQNLEERLLKTRDEHSAALEARKYADANSLSKLMSQIIRELDSRHANR